ncbi:MAG: ATP-dependent RecD-like DNA helicase [Clostridiales bacterium]|nr:ATP-dependent RecD-like DNA helicase [Clostridiales bacterium]
MAIVKGYVEHIVYRNTDNGYTVMEVVSGSETYTLVGTFPHIQAGEPLEAEGSFVTHPLYGEQLSVEKYELTAPEDVVSIERYLGSGAIKGIGPSLASRIVKKFKADTLRIIDEEPERLAEIKGISENGARQIAFQVAEKKELRQAMIFLQQYGISLNLAVQIYERYGSEMYSLIQTNPYRIADDIPGVGFKIADEIAYRAGIQMDSDFRIRSGLYYTLTKALGSGHVYLPLDILLRNASELLGVPEDGMDKHIMDLVLDKRIVVKEKEENQIVYLAMYYYMELNTAKMLKDLNIMYSIHETETEKWLKQEESRNKLELDILQKKAVTEAIHNGVTVITGGPGTGKTTTINIILRYFEQEEQEILLAAPTGRAAKRMTEATGYEARTIHRMLEFNGALDEDTDSRVKFERNESNPLDADVIIIDEMSMVDINLMYALLKAVSVGTRLILVGDANQLPSVGPGNVLRDIIESGEFPVVELTKIFRQETASDIVVNAHRIHAGEQIDASRRSKDFLFVKRYDANRILNAVITLVRDKLPPYVEAGCFDIQVMTPMRKGVLGVENLNKILQQFLNGPDASKKEKSFAQGIFREGDKVMQIRNNYQIEWEIRSRYGIAAEKGAGVFNGDMGIIREINLFAETFEVEFDEGRIVTYSFRQADELELAYAITVHKSQGSEYPAVVIPLLTGPHMLMNRNLIYTAVTRAKNCVCIVGPVESFQSMVDNDEERERYSGLDDRIQELSSMELSIGGL